MNLRELMAAYEKEFGEKPPLSWTDDEEEMIAGMEQALRTGKPWVRDPNSMEGVRQ